MRKLSGLRRMGLALALVAALSTTAPPAAKADFGDDARAVACQYLARVISYVESYPQSWLRDYILNWLRKGYAEYC